MMTTGLAQLRAVLSLLERADPDLWEQAGKTLANAMRSADYRAGHDFHEALRRLNENVEEKRRVMQDLQRLAAQRRRCVEQIREFRAKLLEEVERQIAFEVLKGPRGDNQ